MYIPEFNFTLKIINELAAIERLYANLAVQKMIPSLALRLSQENQILATHHSTSIEGNPLSKLDVTNIILSDKIPTTKSETEVKNYFRVLNKIFDFLRNNKKIDTNLLLELHKDLMVDLETKDLGKFRESSVFVGHRDKEMLVVKHNPPFHSREEIERALTELFKWLNQEDEIHPMVKAGIMHHEFVYIHPFYDGNGRMVRIITSYYLLLKKYEVARYFVLDDYYDMDRSLYSDKLHSADPGSKTEWLEYFLEGIVYSLQAALSRIDVYKNTQVEEITGERRVLVTPREEEVLSIIIDKKSIKTSDIEDALIVTRQQAHNLLSSLVNKKILTKFGKTKTSYYRLTKDGDI